MIDYFWDQLLGTYRIAEATRQGGRPSTIPRQRREVEVRINPYVMDDMRSGSDQRPLGRYNGNRPFQQQPRPPQRNQSFESNGPNIKIRGNAHQIFERYVALAREAATADDRVAAENFYQHAEHYFRINNASRDGNQQGISPRPTALTDATMSETEQGSSETDPERSESGWGDDRLGFL